MVVRIHPLSGCLLLVLGLFTLGVAPLAIWLVRRRWPAGLDERGIDLANGARVQWSDVRGVKRVHVLLEGREVAQRFDLDTATAGRVSFVMGQIGNSDEVMDYVFAHLPERARTQP
jgi:hypothetical protein